MTINQLSIFLENKSGTLNTVLSVLKQSSIQIIASTIADTADYGIYRIICSEPVRAFEELRRAGVTVALSDVFAIQLDDQPGRLADVIEVLGQEQVDITYLYTFLLNSKGILVFSTSHPQKAREVIILNHMNFIAEKDLSRWT